MLIASQMGEKGVLYGFVTARDIAKAVAREGIPIHQTSVASYLFERHPKWGKKACFMALLRPEILRRLWLGKAFPSIKQVLLPTHLKEVETYGITVEPSSSGNGNHCGGRTPRSS